MVHEDNEFAHDGGECNFGGFSGSAQPLIKLFELTVGMGGHQCGHVEGASDGSATATDAAASVPLTTFAWVGSQSGQGCGLATIERAQFRHYNVGTLIAFRIGYSDAEVMTKEFGKAIPATSLADLERYEAVVKLLVEGSSLEPFRAKMLPPLETHVGRRDKLIALSRERFAMPRAKIEDKLRRWLKALSLRTSFFAFR